MIVIIALNISRSSIIVPRNAVIIINTTALIININLHQYNAHFYRYHHHQSIAMNITIIIITIIIAIHFLLFLPGGQAVDGPHPDWDNIRSRKANESSVKVPWAFMIFINCSEDNYKELLYYFVG